MADSNNKKNGTLKWIIALCLTATLAIIGWTMTGTLAARMQAMESIRTDQTNLTATVAANTIRLAVLENKYDMIQSNLLEIKVIVQKLQDREL